MTILIHLLDGSWEATMRMRLILLANDPKGPAIASPAGRIMYRTDRYPILLIANSSWHRPSLFREVLKWLRIW